MMPHVDQEDTKTFITHEAFWREQDRQSRLAHLASMKRLVFIVVISTVRERFLYVHQGLHDLNFPTQAQGKRKHLGFLTSLPSCGSKGNQRNGTCKEMDSQAINSQISKLESDTLLHHYK